MNTEIVIAGESLPLEITFTDDNNAAETPASVSYRLDVINGSQVVGDTSLVAASSFTLEIGATHNAMQGSGSRERRRLTVTATYGEDGAKKEQFDYLLIKPDGA